MTLQKDSLLMVQSNPAISNTQGNRMLCWTFIKVNQVKGKCNTFQYSGDSLCPLVHMAEFHCIYTFCVCGRVGKKNSFQAFYIVHSFAFALS